MSTQSTPRKNSIRRRTVTKRPSKSAGKQREERERRNADRAANKKQDSWTKMEEVLNHLALVGLGDGVPVQIQQAVRQKLATSRKALLKKGDPLEIIKPLLDLSNMISDHGIKTGAVINRHLSGIRFFMEEATKETAEDRATVTSHTPASKKDIKGVEMKKMLDRAKGILNQLSDMNELKLAIKNAIETILRSTGYIDNQSTAVYRLETEYDKVGLPKSNYGSEFDSLQKNCNWKKIEGVLDHVLRVCQRPNIAKELQQTMMSKVCAARKYFLRRSDPLQICKPLHELIDILNHHGLQSSDAAKTQLEDVQALSISSMDDEDLNSATSSFREKNCLEVRKALGNAKIYLNYLSEINELKMIVRNSADLIQRGGVYTVEELPALMRDVEYDVIWDIGGLVREIDKTKLPSNLKVAVKVTMSRLKKILSTPSGNTILHEHLENLRNALKGKSLDEKAVACYTLIAAVTDYQNTHWNSDKS